MKDWMKLPGLKALGLGLAAGAMLAATASDAARQACADRERVVERLAEKYGESRQAMGLGANNGVVEVFASSETGTWTITVTMPNGVTCLVASGQAYEAVPEELVPTIGGDDV